MLAVGRVSACCLASYPMHPEVIITWHSLVVIPPSVLVALQVVTRSPLAKQLRLARDELSTHVPTCLVAMHACCFAALQRPTLGCGTCRRT